jgi:hypothetical protein
MQRRGFSLALVATAMLLVGCSERRITAPSAAPAVSPSAPPLAATSGCNHVSGSFIFTSFQFTSATTAVDAGTVTGDVSGTFVAQYFNLQQHGDGSAVMDAHHTITTSGGSITTSDVIILRPDKNPAVVRPNSRVDVTGGTGAYQNATGLLHTHGEVNLATLGGSIDFEGQVCVP